MAEQVTVNHLVAGSIPARAAILHQGDAGFLDFPEKSTVRLLSGFGGLSGLDAVLLHLVPTPHSRRTFNGEAGQISRNIGDQT